MPTRIPTSTVILRRNNQTIIPKIGQPFDFTKDELDSIMQSNKNAVRKPVNESLAENNLRAANTTRTASSSSAPAKTDAKETAKTDTAPVTGTQEEGAGKDALNPTLTEVVKSMQDSGANITVTNVNKELKKHDQEPIKEAELKATLAQIEKDADANKDEDDL